MTDSDGQIRRCVHAYMRDVRPGARREWQHYAHLPTLKDTIEQAALALTSKGKRHPHQRRLKQAVLVAVKNNLLQEIQALRDSASFDAILGLVQACSVPGFGELARYDTALRIGLWRSLLPDKVYLHAGTRSGARNLGLDVSRGYLTLEDLPAQLRALEPHEIEDALCIYKNDFARRAPGLLGQPCASRRRRRAACNPTPRALPRPLAGAV